MSDSGISIGGLASGLDTNSIIDGLVGIERRTVLRLEATQASFNLSLSSWGTLVTNLTSLQTKGAAMTDPDQFDKFSVSSSNEDILTVEGKDGGSPGSFSVSVFQIARSEKIMSRTYASQTTALGIAGEFKVNPDSTYKTENPAAADIAITIEADDSLKDIANKINGAAHIGISASIVKLSDTEYTMVFSSRDTGATGATYTQSVGTVLQDLGILDASGTKGNVAQKLQSAVNTSGGASITADTLLGAIDGAGVAAGDTLTLGGMDRNGNALPPRTFIITDPATQTVGDLLAEIESSFNGMVTAAVENGRLVITDKTEGRSSLQVSITAGNEGGGSLNFGGALTLAAVGKNGVLQVGQDAFFNVDGLNLRSKDNEADDAVQGLNIKMKKADPTETVTATLERDVDAIQKSLQEFVDSFNMVLKYIKEETKVEVTVNKKETDTTSSTTDKIRKGALAGDSSVGRLKSELINIFNRQHEELAGSTYTSLSSVGIGSDPYSGEFKIDEEKFQAALSRDYESVKRLFVKTGSAEDANFTYGLSTKDTKSGRYQVDVDARSVSRLDRSGNVVSTYAANLEGNVLTVSETGSAKGLSLTVPASGSTVFTFSKGMGLEFADYIRTVTDTYDGLVTLRTKGLEDRVKQYDTKIADQESRIANYEAKLKAQFAALEQTMARIQSQSGQMMAALR